jgi:hypothetical protein
LSPRRQYRFRSRTVLLNPVDRLPAEIGRLRDGADALMLVEHRADEIELFAGADGSLLNIPVMRPSRRDGMEPFLDQQWNLASGSWTAEEVALYFRASLFPQPI